ncbi:MAG: 30S ribosome-binding factor RbfA [Christensenellales bacterium]
MNNRMSRIDSEIQTALSSIITYNLSSPDLQGTLVSVIGVKTSKDLRHAKVLISIFPDKDKEKKFYAVKNATPFLRRELAQHVNLRIIPELTFELDNSAEYGAKIDNLIEKIHRDGGNA